MKEGSGKEHLPLCELYEGNLEGGFLYWGPRRICLVRLWNWAPVSVRRGEMGGTFLSYGLRMKGKIYFY